MLDYYIMYRVLRQVLLVDALKEIPGLVGHSTITRTCC